MVQQRLRIADRACGLPCDQSQGVFVRLPTLASDDLPKIGQDLADRDPTKLVSLATRKNGRRDLVDLGRRQDKDRVRGRFLERLEQSVEGRRGEHVDFINDVDPVLPLRRREADLVAQVADVVHPGVGCRVHLDQIQEAILIDRLAVGACVAGTAGRISGQAVDRLGENPRDGRLARAARSGKEIGVTDTIRGDRILEGLDDVILSDDLGPISGTILPIECLAHGGRSRRSKLAWGE